jgi:hypothetical protein
VVVVVVVVCRVDRGLSDPFAFKIPIVVVCSSPSPPPSIRHKTPTPQTSTQHHQAYLQRLKEREEKKLLAAAAHHSNGNISGLHPSGAGVGGGGAITPCTSLHGGCLAGEEGGEVVGGRPRSNPVRLVYVSFVCVCIRVYVYISSMYMFRLVLTRVVT